ncbi:hypothetical protein LguiA_032692 [Lonicera macranthoides]
MEEGRSSSTIETTEAKVKSIFVYPIKSCRGISLSQAPAPLTLTEKMLSKIESIVRDALSHTTKCSRNTLNVMRLIKKYD